MSDSVCAAIVCIYLLSQANTALEKWLSLFGVIFFVVCIWGDKNHV